MLSLCSLPVCSFPSIPISLLFSFPPTDSLVTFCADSYTQLSGGQQQRVAIARAIVTRPSLFLADEPTGNLDSATSRDIMSLFHELHEEGHTIVLITHNDEIADEAERKIYIRDGQVREMEAACRL